MNCYKYIAVSFIPLIFSCKQTVKVKSTAHSVSSYLNTTTAIEPDKEVLLKEHILDSLAAIMQKPVEDDSITEGIKKEQNFINYLTKALQYRHTFNYQFPELKKHDIKVITSNDHNLRIFTWQSPYSGSMWVMQNIIQYKNSQGQMLVESFNKLYKNKDDFAPTPALEKAYHLKSAECERYLLLGNGQMSGTEPYAVAHILNVRSGRFDINSNKFIINGKREGELFISITIKTDEDWDKVKNDLIIRYNPKDSIIVFPGTKETKDSVYLTGSYEHLKYQKEIFKPVVN